MTFTFSRSVVIMGQIKIRSGKVFIMTKSKFYLSESFDFVSKTGNCREFRIVAAILFCLTLSTLCPEIVSGATPSEPFNIVILNSYHQGYSWSDKEIAGFLKRMREVYPLFDPAIENLDSKHHPEADNFESFKDRLRYKLGGQRVDLVVAFDNPALEFLKRYGNVLFPETPVVFGGINDFSKSMLEGMPETSGVAEIMDYEKTLESALKIHPNTKEILVIHDYTESGIAVRKEFEELLPKFSGRARFRFLPPTTIDEAAKEISSLSPDSLGLILTYTTDRLDRSLSLPESTRMLTQASPVPIYSMHETRLGYGIVGGQLIGGLGHGRRVADIALRVLAGEKPGLIHVDMSGGSIPMFDYSQLERFRIPVDALPHGSIIINEPESLWNRYRTLIISTATVVTLLLVMVISLAISLLRLKKAQKEVTKSEAKYRRFVETANEGVWAMDGDFVTTFVNQRMADMLGYSIEEMLGKTVDHFFYQDDLPDHRHNMELRQQGKDQSYERRFRRKDGSTLWTKVSATSLNDPKGNFLGSFAMFTDITEGKQAEMQRSEMQQRLEIALEAGIIGIWDWRIDTGELFQDKYWLSQLGYLGGEVENRIESWSDRIHPDDKARVMEMLDGHLRGELPAYEIEHRLRTKSGQWKWIFTSGKVLKYDDSGKPIRMLGTHLDIHARKLIEEKLTESEQRYKTVADFTHDWEYWVDADGKFLYVSPSCERTTGYTAKEFMDDPELMERILHPDDRCDVLAHFLTARKNEYHKAHKADFRIIRRDGQTAWIGHVCQPAYGINGQPLGRRSSNRDITEQKEAEQALRESEKRYRALVDNLQMGISVINRNMEIVAINPFFAAFYPNVKPGRGQICYSAYNDPPRSSPCSYCPCVFSFQDGKVHECETETPAGKQVRNYRIVSSPIKDDSGEVQFVVEMVEDVTERKSLQSQLAQSQKMEAMGTLAGGIAHDFNNLLQVIIGYSDFMLEQKKEVDEDVTDIQKIYDAGQRGADLVKGLMAFSRQEQAKLVPVNLNDEARKIEHLLYHTIPKNIVIELHLEQPPRLIKADPSQIGQILMNLAINSKDAMPEGGKLVIETQNVDLGDDYCGRHIRVTPGSYVLLSVSDTGAGMDSEILSHIFEPFFTTKGAGKGTGLGLATVYGIVKQHDSHIFCYSEPGYGTTFKIYFPIINGEEEPVSQSDDAATTGGTETILLVDDDEDIRGLGARIMEQEGYSVITAQNGKEGLEIYKKVGDRIDLILLDLIMPVMDGKLCLEEILKINPGAKVLLASGYSPNGSARTLISRGAKGFVSKPFLRKELLVTIREVLNAKE